MVIDEGNRKNNNEADRGDAPIIKMQDIRWLNLTGNKGQEKTHWRSMAKRHSFPKWQDADGIYAEMLKPKSGASFQLQWDEFLLSDVPQWHGATNDILPTNFEDLKITLNAHAKYHLQQEIDFYHRYGALKAEQECQKLLNLLEHDPDSIYLQMSWGSGWRGITGDWMDIGLVGGMRQLYNLGRTDMPFPKTRRLAVSGEPKLPLGTAISLRTNRRKIKTTASRTSSSKTA